MSQEPIKVAVLVGSTREGRVAPSVLKWFAGQAANRPDLELDILDLAETGLPENLDGLSPAVAAVRPRISAADAYVIVVPEYNHSYPAPLKTAIDCFQSEWRAKPAGFVSYGGMAGGLRAVEHLRQVLAELHVVGIRDTVSFHNIMGHFDADGADFPAQSEECNAAAKTMLDQLTWWAQALREARAKRPYS